MFVRAAKLSDLDRIGQIYDEYEDNYNRGRDDSQIYL